MIIKPTAVVRALGARAGAAAERTGGVGGGQEERRREERSPWEFLDAWESWNGHVHHAAGLAPRRKVRSQEELLPCSAGIWVSAFCSVGSSE